MRPQQNIYYINDKYHIVKTLYNKKINYGSYDTLVEALNQRDKLIAYNWIKCQTTGYSRKESFYKYVIRSDLEDRYVIINKDTGTTYGSYKNYKFASIIKKILPYYQDDVDIKKIERQAQKEFYKHITQNKLNKRYYVIYDGYVKGTFKKLSDALSERDIMIRFNGDEELMCEDPTVVYDYSKEELPPFFHRKENITCDSRRKNKYKVQKQIKNHPVIIGFYPTYNLAVLVKDYLDKNEWNKETIRKITHITQIIHDRNKYIHRRNNKYYVELSKNHKINIYAQYKDIELARFVRNNLIDNHWDKDSIERLEEEYYKQSIPIKYYYDNTDYLKSF